jgi:hypothetical protein
MRTSMSTLLLFCSLLPGCGRTSLIGNPTSVGGLDLGGAPHADLALGLPGDGGVSVCGSGGTVCPPGLVCSDGQCCGGLGCSPPVGACGPDRPCANGAVCIEGACLPGTTDLAVTFDQSIPGAPADLAVTRPVDLAQPPRPPDLAGGCRNDAQCPAGDSCDWLTGSCVPMQSCNTDGNCGANAACIAGQCLPVTTCLPIGVPLPGIGTCSSNERCAFPPGVCVPDANCGAGASCPGGEACVAGYCQPSACGADSDCNDGYACVGGQCRARRYCGFLDRCPRPLQCVAHVCQ